MKKNKKYRWGIKLAALALSSSVLFSSLETASAATYTVKSGDSLWKIASQQGVSLQALMSWNHLSTSTIYAGQKLNLNTLHSTVPKSPASLVQIAKQQLGDMAVYRN